MRINDAITIFKNIERDQNDVQVKGEAIYEVSKMPTHNSITKDEAFAVIKFLLNLAYDLPESEEEK